jgi:hypothetical protein
MPASAGLATGICTGKKRSERRKVTGEAFSRNFLQHVLPSRFQKMWRYGFWGSNCCTGTNSVADFL